jgi:Fic family protein
MISALKTFLEFDRIIGSQPPRVGVLLGRVDVGKGREGLYLAQLPELLDSLADQTRVESIRASTAIEGYEVDADRAEKLVHQPDARIRNRNEREFAGYRDAIDELMRADQPERLSVPFLLHVHRQLYTHTGGGGGQFKREDNVIAARDENGRRVEIFVPPGHEQAEGLTVELVARYNEACDEQKAHSLVLLAAFVLDFLAIHPVADGNGRLARLLTTHELMRTGYGVARYVSVEQRIWETKNSYYEALRQSQTGWHEAEHDLWPWIEYLIGILARSYEDFEAKIATSRSTKGMTKQEITRRHILTLPTGRTFRLRDLRAALRGISDPTFRIVLKDLKSSGEVDVEGTGPGAVWTRTAPDAVDS